MKYYKISEVTKLVNLNQSTLRYYEKVGLISTLEKDESGNRKYSSDDIQWIKFLIKLKHTGMKLSEMLKYSELRYIGDSTAKDRRELLENQLQKLKIEIDNLKETYKYVEEKIEFYKKMESEINGKK
ncbi:MAG: MerR family transcriptional regulator [Sebaldella sp.]|mgnify:FL=1|nr:MerR family transcriptional regulator [Sebaldella sp.]